MFIYTHIFIYTCTSSVHTSQNTLLLDRIGSVLNHRHDCLRNAENNLQWRDSRESFERMHWMTTSYFPLQVADPVATMPRPTTATASRVVCRNEFKWVQSASTFWRTAWVLENCCKFYIRLMKHLFIPKQLNTKHSHHPTIQLQSKCDKAPASAQTRAPLFSSGGAFATSLSDLSLIANGCTEWNKAILATFNPITNALKRQSHQFCWSSNKPENLFFGRHYVFQNEYQQDKNTNLRES